MGEFFRSLNSTHDRKQDAKPARNTRRPDADRREDHIAWPGRVAAAFLILWAWPCVGASFPKPERQTLPDFDARDSKASPPALSPDQSAALARLRDRLPRVRVEFDPLLRTPRSIIAADGFLTGPNGWGRGVSEETACCIPANDRHRVVKAFLQEHRALFGHGPEALDHARIQRDYVTPHNGMKTVAWQQEVDGIPVYGAVLTASVTKNDELINLSSLFVPDLKTAANAAARHPAQRHRPDLSAQEAAFKSARDLGEDVPLDGFTLVQAETGSAEQRHRFKASRFNGDVELRLVWLPIKRSRMRLC